MPQSNYQNAIDRALALRLRAKKEEDENRRKTFLDLAQRWEIWADYCRTCAAKGEAPDFSGQPPEDI